MTTIRKIVTSKIDGNDANADNDNEIRPFGEAALYVDDNWPTDQLVLSIHDGVRTHVKSKVVGPGVLYGSGADSGDGLGFDTIKLIPDDTLKSNGTDQYIIIDPTQPGHIHVRAGGTIDASSAELFVGGEKTHVKVSDNADTVTIKTTDVGDTEQTWTFDNTGRLTFPQGGAIEAHGMGWIGFTNGESGSPLSIAYKEMGLGGPAGLAEILLNGSTGFGNVSIYTQNTNTEGSYQWVFGEDGETVVPGTVTFPDNTIQSTAWAGGRVVSVPAASTGAIGDLQGDIAFSNGYFYYCTADKGSFQATLLGGYVGAYPSILQGDYPQPLAGWTFVWNTVTYTVVGSSGGNPGEWFVQVDQSLDTGAGGTITFETPSGDIWKRVAWSGDTW